MRRKKTKGVLKSGKIYSAQAYLELVLGECYILDCLKPLLPQIERALYLAALIFVVMCAIIAIRMFM